MIEDIPKLDVYKIFSPVNFRINNVRENIAVSPKYCIISLFIKAFALSLLKIKHNMKAK